MRTVPIEEGAADPTVLGEAFEQAAVAMAVYSDDARYIACNEAFCVLTGYSREEIGRMRVGESLGWEPEQNRRLFHDLVMGHSDHGSGGLRRKNGERVTVDVQGIPTAVAGLPYVIALYTER